MCIRVTLGQRVSLAIQGGGAEMAVKVWMVIVGHQDHLGYR